MDWVCSISMTFAGVSVTWLEVALKMHTTPNSEITSTMINRGQSKYFIRLLSKRLSRMYLKNALILESIFLCPCGLLLQRRRLGVPEPGGIPSVSMDGQSAMVNSLSMAELSL